LSDGEHTVTIRTTDHAGNRASAIYIWSIDTTPPKLTVAHSWTIRSSRTPIISGTTEPDITVTLALDLDADGSTDVVHETVADEEGGWRVDTATDLPRSGSMSPDGIPAGTYTTTITATDVAGNQTVREEQFRIKPPLSDPQEPPDEPAEQSAALYLPLVQHGGEVWQTGGNSDLIGTLSLSPTQRSFVAGEAVEITVVITNVGQASTRHGFWVDLYINPTTEPAVNQFWYELCGLNPCTGITWGVDQVLKPGDSITLRSTADSYAVDYTRWPGWFAAGTSDLYLLVDSWDCSAGPGKCVAEGAQREQNEENNRFHLGGLQVTGANPGNALVQAPPLEERERLP
jgi:hypothetical protein